MPDVSWEKTASRNTNRGALAAFLKIITIGMAANPEPWEVEYTNRKTNAIVRGIGATEADADSNARARFLNIGNPATTP
jgi:hypothetical protein